ncbi:FMN-dependent NADH-azoreductase [metagenome]|uniref:FMN-dependent NADH-azoreductase n=1 Tax=metagenome TaxID=256318 RepID=A0A2P2BZ28_9ZZZZ
MPKRVLHIIATPRGLASNTGRISGVLLEALHDKYADLEVSTLDLFSADLPAVAGSNIKSKYALMTGQSLDDAARSSWSEIERTIEQFLAADIYLLTVPMWNFGIPYALKYYIDAIVQPGYLFKYNELGYPEGLVTGKQMVCVTSRGADYSQEPLASLDFVESYLRSIFGFVGIADMKFFNAQPMDISVELGKQAHRAAIAEVRSWVETGAWDSEPSGPTEAVPA